LYISVLPPDPRTASVPIELTDTADPGFVGEACETTPPDETKRSVVTPIGGTGLLPLNKLLKLNEKLKRALAWHEG